MHIRYYHITFTPIKPPEMKTITIQQLKDFASSLEEKAKQAKDAGVRAGLYQAVVDTWTLINQQIQIKQS